MMHAEFSEEDLVQSQSSVTTYYYHDGFPGGSDDKESTCNVGDLGSVPGLGRSPGGGHGNPLHYSCLENPHDDNSSLRNNWWTW